MKRGNNPNFLGVERGVWAGVLIGFSIPAWWIASEVVSIISFVGGLILWYLPSDVGDKKSE